MLHNWLLKFSMHIEGFDRRSAMLTLPMVLEHCYDIFNYSFRCMAPSLRFADLVWITPPLRDEVLNIENHREFFIGSCVMCDSLEELGYRLQY